mmetsp:Transcript_148685/g.414230  ORF Transcript_148685/g.414230 Transcript_148685/m.414230 type:complete len:232 (+) Transcript_148685:339-1034(+)
MIERHAIGLLLEVLVRLLVQSSVDAVRMQELPVGVGLHRHQRLDLALAEGLGIFLHGAEGGVRAHAVAQQAQREPQGAGKLDGAEHVEALLDAAGTHAQGARAALAVVPQVVHEHSVVRFAQPLGDREELYVFSVRARGPRLLAVLVAPAVCTVAEVGHDDDALLAGRLLVQEPAHELHAVCGGEAHLVVIPDAILRRQLGKRHLAERVQHNVAKVPAQGSGTAVAHASRS